MTVCPGVTATASRSPTLQAAVSERWLVQAAAGRTFLTRTDFAVYAYLCRCANRLRKAFPSFTHMANALRVAVTTVQTAIKNLAAAGLLLKAAFRAGKHNLYILVDAKKEAACGQTQTAVHKAHKNKNYYTFWGGLVKCLAVFLGMQYAKFCGAVIRLTLLTVQKEELYLPVGGY